MSPTPVRIETLAEGRQRLSLADDSAALTLSTALGLSLPRYHFRLGRAVHAAPALQLFRVQRTLQLCNDLTGEAELSELHCAPELDASARAVALGTLARAAQQALRQQAAAPQWLVIELPGWRDASGHSPFWQALGARFCPLEPQQALLTHGPAWVSHLAALLPRQMLYLSFLGTAASQACATAAEPTLAEALQALGFLAALHVRIDDGGPVLAWPIGAA
ncbi:arginine N-succinyltransferase [Paucibacter sp. APW11]|uniref:Arginine N-succinyltransferase n=1 Tax=Roseateles aquae TaxID=3077235 RepID=A0ABU3PEH4_9BURK|nr:arginine N-succinyltransferase [Paucibacter sp. APW11]MDT9000969.1 arginine N-succinyltransferase [Paucibacter sp. APW11]